MMKYNYLLSVLLFVTLLPLTPLHSDELKTQASNQDYRGLKICEAPCRCFGEPLNPVRADLQRLIEDVEKYENEMRRMKKINQSLVSGNKNLGEIGRCRTHQAIFTT